MEDFRRLHRLPFKMGVTIPCTATPLIVSVRGRLLGRTKTTSNTTRALSSRPTLSEWTIAAHTSHLASSLATCLAAAAPAAVVTVPRWSTLLQSRPMEMPLYSQVSWEASGACQIIISRPAVSPVASPLVLVTKVEAALISWGPQQLSLVP